MPILRYIPGQYNQKYQLKQKIKYVDDPLKRIWGGNALPRQLMVGACGVNFDTAYETFMAAHVMNGFRGSRLFHHLLLDFEEGLVTPFQVKVIGQEQCLYLNTLKGMYVWGIHSTKKGIPHPHMHIIINSVLPSCDRKLQIKKKTIMEHKIWANEVLYRYHLPPISMWLPDEWMGEDDE